MKVFTLKKRKDTKEFHLFEAKMNNENTSCIPDKLSICEKMDINENEQNIFSCLNEQKAREECAEQGRKVCGICVSSLYASN